MDNMDQLVREAAGCGKFQLSVVLSIISAQFVSAWGMMLMSFGNYHEGWQCPAGDREAPNVTDQLHNLTELSLINRANNLSTAKTPVILGNLWYVQNSSYNSSESSKLEHSCSVYTQCPSLIVFNTNSASTIVSEYGLLCDKAWVQSVIISIQMAGVFVGCSLAGYFGDRFGRKVGLYSSLAIHAVVNFIPVFSTSWEMYVVFRFLIGLAAGGIITSSFVYPLEFVNQTWRTIITGIPMWTLGSSSFAVAVLILKNWRHLHIATAVLSALFLLPVFWVPESIRWLAVHGKMEQAKQVANGFIGTKSLSLQNTPVLNIQEGEEEKTVGTKGRNYSYVDLITTRSLRRNSLVMGFTWCVASLVYYALTFGVKALSGNFYINLIISCVAELPGMLFIIPLSKKLGRRLATVVYFVFVSVACMSVTLVTFLAPESIRDTATTVLALLAKIHMLGGWTILALCNAELFPTVVRNLSWGYINVCARIGGILAPYLIPTSSESLYVSFLVMGGLLLVCSALIMTLPETKGRPLEDLMKIKSRKLSVVEEEENVPFESNNTNQEGVNRFSALALNG